MLSREDEKLFTLSTVVEEKPLLVTDKETFQPAYSPDGKEVAYLEERTTLKVINLDSKKSRTILEGKYNYSYSDGDQWYQWSPDGEWFLVQYSPQHLFSNEIGLVDAQGEEEIRNLTNSGYEDRLSKWMMSGKMMIWFTDRKGMRSHGSWGSQYDVYGMFFRQEAFDTFNMTKEELEVYKKEKYGEGEKKEKKDEEEKEIEPVKIDFEGLDERVKRLTIHSSRVSGAVMTEKGDQLYYLSKFEKHYDLWVHDFLENETKKVVDLKAKSGGELQMNEKENELYVLSGGKIYKVELKKHTSKPVAFSAEVELKTEKEKEYLFEHIWRQVKKKFYVKDLHGVDWDFYKDEYKRFLPHINNNYDFAEMLSEMLGELNASHTGARYYSQSDNEDKTAALGIFIDWEYDGKGIKIAEILDKSPLVKAESKARKGHVIEQINKQPVQHVNDYFKLLNHQTDKKILLTLYNPNTKERWEETVKPVSQGEKGQMLYERWVEMMREKTEELSDGEIGYLHVRSMNDRSFRQTYSDLFGKNYHKKGVVVDTRFNGGGWLHNDLAVLFNGTKYVNYYPRGQHFGHDPMDQWTKKSAVLMSEGNYSDAHGFPYAYKTLDIGKTIGMPVPGTMTAVWWERLQDPSLVFGIPQVGSKNLEGEYLENQQLEPDIKVRQEYSKVSRGIDQQLIRAVEELME
jgi:C-terminal processing protease CtpA/Prc